MHTPRYLKTLYPLSDEDRAFVAASRRAIRARLNREERRLAIVTGPCSIHHFDSALSYGEKLKTLIDLYSDTLLIVMRAYVEKPRTRAGWKGFVYDPTLTGESDLEAGLELSRKLFVALTKMRLPIAIELLDPNLTPFFDDVISWGFIGSRTASSQIHRQLVSHLPFPVGFKNATDGALEPAVNSMLSSREPHAFFGIDQEGILNAIESRGNSHTHLVLRGSDSNSNYDEKTLSHSQALMRGIGIERDIMIDCSHGNSGRDHQKQPEVFQTALKLTREYPILGLMIESHLKEGRQTDARSPEISITDACIGFDTTRELLELASIELALPTNSVATP